MPYKDIEKRRKSNNQASRRYKKTHPEQVKKDRQKFKELPDYSARLKKYNLSSKYKITIDNIKNIFLQQNGRCAICFIPLDPVSLEEEHKSKKTRIDHDHSTGEIRGLLCRSCNTLLGMCQDDINILMQAIKYLRRSIGCSN